MELNQQLNPAPNIIRSVAKRPGGYQIQIAGEHYTSSVILTPASVEMWHATAISTLTLEDFAQLAKLPTEVLILGTGSHIEFPSPALTKPLIENHTGFEVMDTPAACRTYNLLRADDRPVIAALIL